MKTTQKIASALLIAGLLGTSVSAFDYSDERTQKEHPTYAELLADYNVDADTLAELEALRESRQENK